jgi:ATP-dependent RNA helicase DeaD
MIGKKFKQELVPNGRSICEKQLFDLIDRMENVDIYNEEIESFMPSIYKKLAWLDREEIIKRFVSMEFNSILDYYKNTQDINVTEKTSSGNVNFCRFFISLGRKDDLTPQALIGLINDISRNLSVKIGRIELMHSFSFFEADINFRDDILKGFTKKKFNGKKILVKEAEPYTGKNNKTSKNDKNNKRNNSNKNKEKKTKDTKKKFKKKKSN